MPSTDEIFGEGSKQWSVFCHGKNNSCQELKEGVSPSLAIFATIAIFFMDTFCVASKSTLHTMENWVYFWGKNWVQ